MSMKFTNVFENSRQTCQIQSYEPDHFMINQVAYRTSLLVRSDQTPTPYTGGLPSSDWLSQQAASFKQYDVFLIGEAAILSVARYQEWQNCLAQAGLFAEIMNTAAACRTFNILSEEGRTVCGLLLLQT